MGEGHKRKQTQKDSRKNERRRAQEKANTEGQALANRSLDIDGESKRRRAQEEDGNRHCQSRRPERLSLTSFLEPLGCMSTAILSHLELSWTIVEVAILGSLRRSRSHLGPKRLLPLRGGARPDPGRRGKDGSWKRKRLKPSAPWPSSPPITLRNNTDQASPPGSSWPAADRLPTFGGF